MNMRLLALAAALSLAACGGGGGGGDGNPGPTITLSQLQGFWNGPVTGADFGGAAVARSVVLDDGRSWVFLHGAGPGEPLVGLATGQLAIAGASFTGTGTRYGPSGTAETRVNWSGEPVANGLSVSASSSGSSAVTSMALTYDERFNTPAISNDVQGDWVFTQANGSIAGTWTVAADGSLTGLRTPGCTYAGQIVPHAGVAVYDVSITETCTGSPAEVLVGVAKLNSAKTFLTFGLTTADASQGQAFVVGRPGV